MIVREIQYNPIDNALINYTIVLTDPVFPILTTIVNKPYSFVRQCVLPKSAIIPISETPNCAPICAIAHISGQTGAIMIALNHERITNAGIAQKMRGINIPLNAYNAFANVLTLYGATIGECAMRTADTFDAQIIIVEKKARNIHPRNLCPLSAHNTCGLLAIDIWSPPSSPVLTWSLPIYETTL
jgi:hypothetical protein